MSKRMLVKALVMLKASLAKPTATAAILCLATMSVPARVRTSPLQDRKIEMGPSTCAFS